MYLEDNTSLMNPTSVMFAFNAIGTHSMHPAMASLFIQDTRPSSSLDWYTIDLTFKVKTISEWSTYIREFPGVTLTKHILTSFFLHCIHCNWSSHVCNHNIKVIPWPLLLLTGCKLWLQMLYNSFLISHRNITLLPVCMGMKWPSTHSPLHQMGEFLLVRVCTLITHTLNMLMLYNKVMMKPSNSDWQRRPYAFRP